MIASIPLLFLSALVSAAPTPMPAAVEAKAATQIYYLVNCFSDTTDAAYAAIAYYPDKSLSVGGETPTEVAIINSNESVDYEDETWFATTPFTATVVIFDDAYTAKAGSKVGTATVSTSTKALPCYRLTRFVLYEPANEQCYTDYACQVRLTISSAKK